MMRQKFNNKNELYIELALRINAELYNEKSINIKQYKEAQKSLLKRQGRKEN